MGADEYDSAHACRQGEQPALGIGKGAVIERAIVDKNCRIGDRVTLRLPKGFPENGERGPVLVRDGIICVPKGTSLPDGWTF